MAFREHVMTRYYFDIHDHKGFHRDSDGIECDDAEDARKQAQTILADIIREQVPNGDIHEITGQVRDHAGLIVYKAQLRLQGTMHPGNGTAIPGSDAPG